VGGVQRIKAYVYMLARSPVSAQDVSLDPCCTPETVAAEREAVAEAGSRSFVCHRYDTALDDRPLYKEIGQTVSEIRPAKEPESDKYKNHASQRDG